ncbi:MAG: hypothetical protein A2Z14_01960 [Chloroflexi bacterium RBG_16_48_8]|nr:MAG: hypothetical protein A2Z14_01960 [Chloroflexi bacterium RBG_16_48_8]
MVIILVLISCDIQTIQGSRNIITEARDVGGFNRIELEGMGKVILTQGEEESLTIEADDNLMEYITTEVTR